MSWKNLLLKVIKKENICVVATHSRQQNLSVELIGKWLDSAIAWIRAEGFEPSSFSTYGVSGYRDAEIYPFSDALAKRLAKLDSGSIEHVGIYGGEKDNVSVSLTNAQVPHATTCAVWSWRSGASIPYKKIADAFSIANHLELLEYGFSYHSDDKDFYTSLADLSPFDRETGAGKVWVDGKQALRAFQAGQHPIVFLRDVYPVQVLSAEHLGLHVGSSLLKDWINEDQTHGRFEPLEGVGSVWVITDDQIDVVRATLASHSLLTAYIPKQGSILEMYGK